MTTVDMHLVKEILNDALKACDAVDSVIIEDNTLGNKAKEAHINRDLLNLSDQLGLASSLVKNEYWSGKGMLSYEL